MTAVELVRQCGLFEPIGNDILFPDFLQPVAISDRTVAYAFTFRLCRITMNKVWALKLDSASQDYAQLRYFRCAAWFILLAFPRLCFCSLFMAWQSICFALTQNPVHRINPNNHTRPPIYFETVYMDTWQTAPPPPPPPLNSGPSNIFHVLHVSCHFWPWLSQFSGVVPSCFSFLHSSARFSRQAILYSVSCIRKPMSTYISFERLWFVAYALRWLL